MPIGRHDHVGYQGIDDFAEGGTDDDTDRQVDDIAFHGKFFKFLHHSHNTFSPKIYGFVSTLLQIHGTRKRRNIGMD